MTNILYDNDPDDIPYADFQNAMDMPYDTDVGKAYRRILLS